MILKAQIVSIDYNTGSCQVHIPQFDIASSTTASILSAQFCEPPGVYKGYNVSDLVWVAFEKNLIDEPVVLGHLGVPTVVDSAKGGALLGQTLDIQTRAQLPKETFIKTAESDFDSLVKIINKIKSLESLTKTTTDLPTTLEAFQQSIINLESKVKTIESNGVPDNPNPVPTPSTSILTDTIIASCQTTASFSEFKQGTILFVRDQLGKSQMLGAKTNVYAVNTRFNDTQKTIIEFSNSYTDTEVPGDWYIIALFDGGCLVQYNDRNVNTAIPKTVKLFDDDTNYDLFDDSGNALSYYYELEKGAPGNGAVLKSVRSDTLCFFDNQNRQITNSDHNKAIYKITLNDEDKTPLIQQFSTQNAADRSRNIVAILNLNFNSEILRQNHFVGYTGSIMGIFMTHEDSINTSIQYLYLPDDYNLNYEILDVWNGQTRFSELNQGICAGSKAIRNIYIPTNTGIIRQTAFAEAGLAKFKQNNENTVAITNLENSAVTYIEESAFSKVTIKDRILKLPYDPINNRVTFGKNCFYIHDGITPISTIIAHSQIDFDHTLNGTKHSGCFNHYGKSVNYSTFELVFENTKNKTFDKATVLDYLHPNNSSIKSFLRTKTLLDKVDETTFNDSITDDVIIQMLEAVNAQVSSDFTYSIPVGEETLQVRFIDRAKKTDYHLASTTNPAENPTIIYNY